MCADDTALQDENVLDGTRERAMVFKRKQLLGGLLRVCTKRRST